MGSALLNGWISSGIKPRNINVLEPSPSDWLISLTKTGLNLNNKIITNSKVCVIAVKPQVVNQLLSENIFEYNSKTLFVSIVAGVELKTLSDLLGDKTAIVRVMPNTPATIRKGVSCLIANRHTCEDQIELVEKLFSVVSKIIRLDTEKQMDAVTALSGSGPAYVFFLIEVLTSVGIELGLDAKLAKTLSVSTVSGAGMLAEKTDTEVEHLRHNVTSPNGTTEAALNILMDPSKGLLPLMRQTVTAAYLRSKELSLE